MLAMQYFIRLPMGFSPARLRARVAERLHLFEKLDGLIQKSYLFDDAGGMYAPLYVWDNHLAARAFLLDERFANVIQAFGRPRVRHWTVLEHDRQMSGPKPVFASWELDKVPADERLSALAAREHEAHRSSLAGDGLFSRTVALDPDRWEVVRLSLWRDAAAMAPSGADCMQGYEVLHVAEPSRRSAA